MTQKENKMSKKICVWNINSATNKTSLHLNLWEKKSSIKTVTFLY